MTPGPLSTRFFRLTEQASFSDRLLGWWDDHGRKDLPWQHPRTPYRVWVSEIMLQQTQVGTVIVYFERFMDRFPELGALAEAPLDEVLASWAGLGYYARARNLHKTARLCMAHYQGGLPETAEELAALPGIGDSTANAIISQAWDTPLAILDGNVRRVLARHEMIEGWSGKTSVRRVLWREAEKRLPPDRGADYSQAIMDLGATLCTRSRPHCTACPLNADCKAFQSQTVGRYPSPRPKLKIREKDLHMLIITRPDGSVLLERRPPAGIWGGLWSLPDGESVRQVTERLGLGRELLTPVPGLEHRLTHMRLNILPQAIRAEPAISRVECNQDRRWFKRSEWQELGLPRPVLGLLLNNANGAQHDAHGALPDAG